MRTMFRQILQLFKGTDPLRETLEMFASMIDDGEWMYQKVLDIHGSQILPSSIEAELFARDRQINAKEREIRRRLVEYLSISEKPDVSSCLILMSVSKDAERVGDYIKNMYDICLEMEGVKREVVDLDERGRALRLRCLPLFQSVRKAFMTSDRALAETTLEAAMNLSRDAEIHVWAVAARNELSSKEAVARALSARHVKRIARHLGNIVTAVIQPVDWMNYSDEPHPQDAEMPPKRRGLDEEEEEE